MTTPKKKKRSSKKQSGKIVVKQKAELRKKEVQPKDSLRNLKTKRIIPDNGVTFKIKIKRK